MKDCVFCNIVKGKLPANILFENEDCVAFPPLEQVAKGHILVIPKKHFENIFDIESEQLKEIIDTAQKLAKKAAQENNATGINILHASGKDAQQSVFHFHLHIVPRYPGDNLDLWLRNKL